VFVLCDAHQSISAGGHLGAVVAAEVRRGAPRRDEPLEDRDGLIGGDRAVDVHDQRLARELVDDVQQLQRLAVGGLVELEVKRPHMIGALGAQTLRRPGGVPEPWDVLRVAPPVIRAFGGWPGRARGDLRRRPQAQGCRQRALRSLLVGRLTGAASAWPGRP
jgi:hypothetical protein